MTCLHLSEDDLTRDAHKKVPEGVIFRKKPIGFWSNRSLAREQAERELRGLPEALKYSASLSVRLRIDGSLGNAWKKYVDFQAAIPIRELRDAGHVPVPIMNALSQIMESILFS